MQSLSANQAREFEGQASLRCQWSCLLLYQPRILKSNELPQPYPVCSSAREIGSISCLPHYLPAGSQDSNEWWDLPVPGWSVYASILTGRAGRLLYTEIIHEGWTTTKRLGEEEYYFLFHIIIHNAGVINPRTCGFISSCRGAKLKLIAKHSSAQPGRDDRDPGDKNAACSSKNHLAEMMVLLHLI